MLVACGFAMDPNRETVKVGLENWKDAGYLPTPVQTRFVSTKAIITVYNHNDITLGFAQNDPRYDYARQIEFVMIQISRLLRGI